jgi:hypothetical protein
MEPQVSDLRHRRTESSTCCKNDLGSRDRLYTNSLGRRSGAWDATVRGKSASRPRLPPRTGRLCRPSLSPSQVVGHPFRSGRGRARYLAIPAAEGLLDAGATSGHSHSAIQAGARSRLKSATRGDGAKPLSSSSWRRPVVTLPPHRPVHAGCLRARRDPSDADCRNANSSNPDHRIRRRRDAQSGASARRNTSARQALRNGRAPCDCATTRTANGGLRMLQRPRGRIEPFHTTAKPSRVTERLAVVTLVFEPLALVLHLQRQSCQLCITCLNHWRLSALKRLPRMTPGRTGAIACRRSPRRETGALPPHRTRR